MKPKKKSDKKTPPKQRRKRKKKAAEKTIGEKFYEQHDVYLVEAYEAFLAWSIMTEPEKKKEKILTQKDFAQKWKVHTDTVVDWKKRPDFIKRKSDMLRIKLCEDIPDVMGDLRTRIKKYGQSMDVELYLAYAEGWDKKKVLELLPPVRFGNDDIRAMVEKLPAERQKFFKQTLAKLLMEIENANESEL